MTTNLYRSTRIEALDVFRALTMFLMLFVNDIPGLKEIPHWMFHAAADEDMLGFSDTIFPAFLFAMGMAVPFAIQNREGKGFTDWQNFVHVLLRTVALIIMGLFTVNLEYYDGSTGWLSHSLYSILMTIAFFLVWCDYTKSAERKRTNSLLQLCGLAILIALFFLYKNNPTPFVAHWWGILGLIGYSYFVSAVVYLIVKRNLLLHGLILLLAVLLTVASTAGWFDDIQLIQMLPSNAALYALGLSGMFASLLMQRVATPEKPGRFLLLMCGLGVVCLILGMIVHPYWIISKIHATAPWYFFCCAIYFPFFALLYWLCQTKHHAGWFRLISPAGNATLTCYIIPYGWYALCNMVGFQYPDFLCAGLPGILRSLVYSLLIVGIAWLLVKVHVKLKI